jgi:hypothetical protein
MEKIEREQLKEKLRVSLKSNLGNVTAVCKEVGIGRKTFYRILEEDEEWRKEVEEIREEGKQTMDDFTEGKLFELIREGNVATIIFYLKTRHPDYKPKLITEIEGKLKVEKELTEEDKQLLVEAIKYATGTITNKDTPRPELQEGISQK